MDAKDTFMQPTFSQVVAELLPVYEAKAKKTFADFDTATRLHLMPYFGEKPIGQCAALWRHYCAHERMKRPDRKLWHDRKTMRVILGYAFDCDYIAKIPRLPLDPYDKRTKEGRVVSREELEKVCAAASSTTSDLIRLLYFTGMRFSEARLLRLDQVDFEKNLVRLDAKDTKTRSGRTYPLPTEAKNVLFLRSQRVISRFFFPNGSDPRRPISNSQRSFQRALKRSGVKFTLHDLRRSFITNRVKAGMPAEVVGRLVGASAPLVRSVYLCLAADEWCEYASA